MFGARPQGADAGRAVELVAGEDVEIAVDRGDIDLDARRRLAAVEQKFGADRVGQIGGAARVEDRAEHVRDMGEGDDRVALGEHRFGGVEVDPLIGGQRADVDFIAGELPRHDVRVMLERRQQDAVAVPARIGARDEVDRFGRAAGEDDFIGVLSAEQFRGRGARGFIGQRHVGRALVDRAVDGRVIAGIGLR